MNIKRPTQYFRSIRCLMFLSLLFLLAAPHAFPQSATNTLPKLLPPLEPLPPTFWEQHGVAALVGGSILLALAAVVVWQILKSRPQRVLPPAIVAREALAKCLGRPEDGKVLSEVSQALRRYVVAALKFPRGEFTTAEFCGELEHSERVTAQSKQAITDFLHACDERKFSATVSSAPLGAAGRALELIDLTEKESCRQGGACATKNERPV